MKFAWLFLVVLFLTGCGVEPTEKELHDAMNKSIGQAMENVASVQGNNPTLTRITNSLVPKLLSLKKIACTPDGNQAYLCDVQAEMEVMGRAMKDTGRLRAVKGNDGWTVLKP